MSRILFCLPRYHTNAVGWVRLLQGQGHAVALHVLQVGPSEDHALCRPTVLGSDIPGWHAYSRLLAQEAPDIVVVRGLTRRFCRRAAVISRLQGRRVIVYDQEDPLPPFLGSTWWRRTLCRMLGLGRITARAAPPARANPATALTLPFAAPEPSWQMRECALVRMNERTEAARILMVGKYRPRKGHAELIEALAALRDSFAFIATFCAEEATAADRAFRRQLEAMCARRGLSRRVRFVANLDLPEMMALYARHEIFILPSRDEPAAVSPIEAVWNGCAALVDAHSGTRHYLPPEGSFVFDAGEPASIAGAIAPLLESPAALQTARQACLDHLTGMAGDDAVLAAMRRVRLQ